MYVFSTSVCVCVCVCVRARARLCVCVCMCVSKADWDLRQQTESVTAKNISQTKHNSPPVSNACEAIYTQTYCRSERLNGTADSCTRQRVVISASSAPPPWGAQPSDSHESGMHPASSSQSTPPSRLLPHPLSVVTKTCQSA